MTTLRIFTIYNYMDVDVKGELTTEILQAQLEEGTTLLLEEIDGSLFLLNNMNVLAIKIIPPIGKENISI